VARRHPGDPGQAHEGRAEDLLRKKSIPSEVEEGLLAVVPRQGGEGDQLCENVGSELPVVGEEARGAAPLADPHPRRR